MVVILFIQSAISNRPSAIFVFQGVPAAILYLAGVMRSFVHTTLINPLKAFMQDSRAIGVVLAACTLVSLLLANTGGWQEAYRAFWTMHFDGGGSEHGHLGWLLFPNSPALVINDGLMAVFFFLVGMEIKREFHYGELSSIKHATLPVAGAIGGMLAPTLLFMLFNKGGQYINGWGIPTATDIAFTLGVAGLLGKRIPVSLKIFITALAIIDDLLAIIVIAFFYGGELQPGYLLACVVIMVILWLLGKTKLRFGPLHWALGIVLWYCTYASGIHATIAGVMFAFVVPPSQLGRFELKLHTPVYFLIVPLFALANTAIYIPENITGALNSRLSWGILTGLCIGKPLGIVSACYLVVKKGFARLPKDTTWSLMIGGGMLCGIGFTMSIFISSLAFSVPEWQDISKISVIVASVIAVLMGSAWLRMVKAKNR